MKRRCTIYPNKELGSTKGIVVRLLDTSDSKKYSGSSLSRDGAGSKWPHVHKSVFGTCAE